MSVTTARDLILDRIDHQTDRVSVTTARDLILDRIDHQTDRVSVTTARDLILDRIDHQGPLPVSEVLEVALYHPVVGFYEAGGSAGGRDGDFLTSPEVGGLFGAMIARALDTWWAAMGRPDPFLVVEAGAGPGTLARTILAAEPGCASALRYVLVERSEAQRAAQVRLPLEEPNLVLPPVDAATGDLLPESPSGPLCASLAEFPRVPAVPKVVLANELLDNLPFDLAERREGAWNEIRVGGPSITEVPVPMDDRRSAVLDHLVPDAPDGTRVPLQDRAAGWLREALDVAGAGGRVAVFDYAATTAELAARSRDMWLRTYRGHARGAGYLEALGSQDVTCDVAVDQLALVRPPEVELSQADWLDGHGVGVLVDEARQAWHDRAHLGDLAALKARSRVNEAAALLDAGGLGGFRVLEWGG